MKQAKPKPVINAQSKLASLAQAASEEDVNSGFMNPVKKKRGRPRKDAAASEADTSPPQGPTPVNVEAQIEANKKLIRPIVKAADAWGKDVGGPSAAMGEELATSITDAAALCVHQYLPSILADHAALGVLLVSVGSWGTKVYFCRRAEIQKMNERIRQQGGAEAPSHMDLAVVPAPMHGH